MTKKIYTTRYEAVREEVVMPLGEYVDTFDVDAIANEVIAPLTVRDDFGNVLLDQSGYYIGVDAEEFWKIVAKHEGVRDGEN